MKVDRSDRRMLDQAINRWEEEGLIDQQTADKLRNSYESKGIDWRRLAQYSFWIAISCIALSILSLLIDQDLISMISWIYETPDLVIAVLCALLAAGSFFVGYRNKMRFPEKVFSNEAFMLIGVGATATAVGYLRNVLNRDDGSYSLAFFLSVLIYLYLAIKLSSKTIWIFMLIALGLWFAIETAYHSGWGFRFWGLNYPARFCLFGFILLSIVVFLIPKIKGLSFFYRPSYIMAILYLFTSLWLLSIFGNYADFDVWSQTKQYHLLYWGILSTSLSALLMWYGVRSKDVIAGEFGFAFLLINLYTRYFEYLWDNLNRALFFLILAASFWLIGRRAEKSWNRPTKR